MSEETTPRLLSVVLADESDDQTIVAPSTTTKSRGRPNAPQGAAPYFGTDGEGVARNRADGFATAEAYAFNHTNDSRANDDGDDIDATLEQAVVRYSDTSIGLERLGTTHASTTASGEDV